MIKVFIVDDSPTSREMISTILQTDPEIDVVACAGNGQEAIDFMKVGKIKPDIVVSDINMPVMNGFEMIEHIMAYHPTPILIVTSLNKESNFMRVLNLGALDIIEKPAPTAWEQLPKIGMELIEKVKLLSRVKVITHMSGLKTMKEFKTKDKIKSFKNISSEKIVTIVSSTGGPNVLLKLFQLLPKDFPAPIVVVQHIAEGFFLQGLIEWFQETVSFKIFEAREGMVPVKGGVYFAPADKNLIFENDEMKLTSSSLQGNIVPSGDAFLLSAAETFRRNLITVILTGMGNDGAKGVKLVKKHKGKVIVQDPKCCVIPGMPEKAIETGCVDQILSVEEIPKELLRLV